MDISAVSSVYGAPDVAGSIQKEKTGDFDKILTSAMKMINETNDLQNAANEEKISFALGESDNTHDLLIAEQKATIALQYTVAVRDKILDGYKEIMNMQV